MNQLNSLAGYVELIEGFIGGRISASDFEGRYLRMFKDDETQRPEREC